MFFSLQQTGTLDGCFATLFSRFWQRYLNATGDDELHAGVGPYFAFRALVVANPVWYPTGGERTSAASALRHRSERRAWEPKGRRVRRTIGTSQVDPYPGARRNRAKSSD